MTKSCQPQVCNFLLAGRMVKGEINQNKRTHPGAIFRKRSNMLWTIFVILLILWLLGLVSGCTMGGVIHILLVIAIVVVLIQVIQGRRRL